MATPKTATSTRTKGIVLIVFGVFALASLLTYFGENDGMMRTVASGTAPMMGGGATSDYFYANTEAGRAVDSDAGMMGGKIAVSGVPALAVPPMMDGATVTIGMMRPNQPSAGPTAAEGDQRVIKNGNLDLIVNGVQDSIDQIVAFAEAANGFVQQSSVNERGDGTFSGYVTVRVPSDAFSASMMQIKGIANVVKSESVTGQDVTEQYTDLEARLNNAKAQEKTFLAVLQKAKSVEDILAVQRELTNVRGTIESLEGQRQYLENQTSFSTISVSLTEEAAIKAPTKEFRPLASMKEAGQALVRVFQTLVVLFIWLVIIGIGVLIPFLLFWAIVLWVLRMLWKRFQSRMMVTPPPTPTSRKK